MPSRLVAQRRQIETGLTAIGGERADAARVGYHAMPGAGQGVGQKVCFSRSSS
jgi:hypothetical protein